MVTERVTGVALLCESGELWSLPAPNRHCHIFALAAFQGASADPCDQGFTTNTGRYVTRQEAAIIAARAGQVIRKTEPVSELFSEDVW